MATVILLRHGRTAANATGILAGWTPGVDLDEVGQAQADAAGERLAEIPLAGLVSSPLSRCQRTSAAVVAKAGRRITRPEVITDDRLGECHYGDWTGQELKVLAKDPLWKVVQQHPSSVTFPGPGGESLATMQHRALSAIRHWDAQFTQQAGAGAVWAAVSHGDVIKAIVADALGMHLDHFQRIHISPCSITVLKYTQTRSFAVQVNDTGADLRKLLVPRRKLRTKLGSEAVVGGGA